MTPHTPSGQQAVEQSDAERYGPSFDRALMGTPQAADAELARLSTEYRDLRKPFMGSPKAIKQRQLREREVLFNLGHAALLWLWHREDAAPTAPSTAAGERVTLSAPRAFETWDDMLEEGTRAVMVFRGWKVNGEESLLERADENPRAREWVEQARAVLNAVGFDRDTFRTALAAPPAQESDPFRAAMHDAYIASEGGVTWHEDDPKRMLGEIVAWMMRFTDATPPAPSVPWQEKAARWLDAEADRIDSNGEWKTVSGAVLRRAASRIRALLSKPAKGESE